MTSTYLFHVDPPAVADPGDELAIQVALRKALKRRAPAIRFVAIPNGAQRTVWAAMKAKAEGMQKGFPDGVLMWAGGGLAICEIKAAGGTLSEDQHVWLNWLTNAGFHAGVFRSVETCLAWLHGLGAPVTDFPVCYSSNPNGQARAENGCDSCPWQRSCLLEQAA